MAAELVGKHIALSITSHSSQQHIRLGGCLRPRPHSVSPCVKIQRWQIFLRTDSELCQTVPIQIIWSLSNDVPPPCQSLDWHGVDSILIYRARSVWCLQTKPPSPLCYANRSNEKIEGEEGGGRRFSSMSSWCIQEFLSFKSLFQHTKRLKRREHCHACTSRARQKYVLFPFAWLLCVTHNLATVPVVAPGQCIQYVSHLYCRKH